MVGHIKIVILILVCGIFASCSRRIPHEDVCLYPQGNHSVIYNDIGKADALYSAGRESIGNGNVEDGMMQLLDAEEIAAGNDDYYFLGLVRRSIAKVCSGIQEYGLALQYRKLEESSFVKAGCAKEVLQARLMLAIVYNNVCMSCEADSIINLILHTGVVLAHPTFLADTYLTAGYTKALQNDWHGVTDAIDNAIRFDSAVINRNALNLYCHALVEQGRENEIGDLLLREEWRAFSLFCLPADFWRKTGNFKMACEAELMYSQYVDTLYHIGRSQNLSAKMVERVNRRMRTEAFIKHLQVSGFLIAGVLTALFVMSAIIYFYIQVRHRNTTEEMLLSLRNREKSEQTLRNLLMTSSTGRFRELKRLYDILMLDSRPDLQRSDLAKKIRRVLYDLRGRRNIERLGAELNTYCCGIFSSLKSEMPNLKESDMAVFVYSALGFPVGIIAALMEKTEANVRNRRSRLRKKIIGSGASRIREYIFLLGETA